MKACDAVATSDAVRGAGRGAAKAAEVKGAFAAKLKEKVGSAKKDSGVEGEVAKKDGAEGTGAGSVQPLTKEVAATAVNAAGQNQFSAEVHATDDLKRTVSIAADKVLVKGKEALQKGATNGKEVEALKGTAREIAPQVSSVTAVKLVEPAGEAVASPVVVQAVGTLSVVTVGKVSHGGESAFTAKAEVEAPREEARMLVASGTVLEVGVAAGTHGWLRVRAELSTGGDVSAQVIASSGVAAESLYKDVPVITAYLAAEQVGLSSLVVHAPQGSSGAQDAAMNFGGALGSGAGGRGAEDGGGERRGEPGQGFGSEISGGEVLQALSGSGGWLSVRV